VSEHLRSIAEAFLRAHLAALNRDEKERFRSETAIGSFPSAFDIYYRDLRAEAPVTLEDVEASDVETRSQVAREASGRAFAYRVRVSGSLVGSRRTTPFTVTVWVDDEGRNAKIAGVIRPGLVTRS